MYCSLYVKVTAAAAISSLMAQIYTLNHEIDPSLARSPPFVSRASLATSAVIITFRQRERGGHGATDTFSARSANFPFATARARARSMRRAVIDAMEIAKAE